jgi:hypothetical protein
MQNSAIISKITNSFLQKMSERKARIPIIIPTANVLMIITKERYAWYITRKMIVVNSSCRIW